MINKDLCVMRPPVVRKIAGLGVVTNVIFVFFWLLFLFTSCRTDRYTLFAEQGETFVHELELHASHRSLDFSNPQKLEFDYSSVFKTPPNSSLEIQYSFSVPPSSDIKIKFKIELETENESWTIPMDFSFLGVPSANNAVYHFAVPLIDNFNGQFKIKLSAAETSGGSLPESSLPVFLIHSMRYINQWFGFIRVEEKYFSTPYISKQNNGSFLISAPIMTIGRNNRNYQLTAEPLSAGKTAIVEAGGLTFEATAEADKIFIPSLFISHNSRVVLTGDRITSFRLTPSAVPEFPVPIRADTGHILWMPLANWRNKDWDIYRWDRFPSILIVDTMNYGVQDKLFKRLAFFTEKAG
ncbi:MAG: hypothetical protein FWB73_09215, partial [Treponema sp.]|nr:hypothetical protein [Treponema sp.]